jgi:formylglycine-generating enzyme required for sulfatase activity
VLPVAAGSGNFADISARGLVAQVLSGYDDTFPATAPVGSFGPNERGLAQMGGNVAEWVHDLYTIYPSGSAAVVRDPTGPEEGELHTIRGSSWMDSSISELRFTYRDYGKKARRDLGFRIVRYAE